MSDALTPRMRRGYDRLRRVRNITSSLKLYKTTATGYTEITGTGLPITTGWYHEYLQDAETGEQFLQILVAEGTWSTTAMTTLAAVVIDSRRHKVNTILRPSGAPMVWQLKANPTGETI